MSRQVQAIRGQLLDDSSETTTTPLVKERQMELALPQLPEGTPPSKQGAKSQTEIPSQLSESNRRQSDKLPPGMKTQEEPEQMLEVEHAEKQQQAKELQAEHAEKHQEEHDEVRRARTHETKSAKTAAQDATDAKRKRVKPAPEPEPLKKRKPLLLPPLKTKEITLKCFLYL